MPSKLFYLNDIMVMISCAWSFCHVMFWVFFMARYRWYGVFKPGQSKPMIVRGQSIQATRGRVWFDTQIRKSAIYAPITFFILALLFYLLGCLMDYQEYTRNGSTFYFGLMDVNDPSRQWFYALGIALLILGLLLIPIMESLYMTELRKRVSD